MSVGISEMYIATTSQFQSAMTSSNTTTNAFNFNADSLTSGYAARISSNSSDTTARNVLFANNDHASATGAVTFYCNQDSTNWSAQIYTTNNTGKGLNVVKSGNSTGRAMQIDNAGTNTGLIVSQTGVIAANNSVLHVYDTAAETTGQGLATITATNATTSIPMLTFASSGDNCDIRLTNRGATPTTAAVIGDLCCVNGKLYICTTAGTPGTWTVVGTQS